MPRRPQDPQHRDLIHLLGVQAGDAGALSALYDEYAPLLYSVCAAILPNAIDAQQAFRDGWRQVWKRAARYQRLEGTVELWLVHVMRDRAFDRLRHMESPSEAERLRAAGRGPLEIPPGVSPPARTAARERMAALPPLERQALELGFFRAMNAEEIGANLEAPAASVRLWQRQAIDKLSEGAGEPANTAVPR